MMIILTKSTCPKCNKKKEKLYCREVDDTPLCRNCVRKWYPPYMTLIKFNQGSYNHLWNLEMGEYEDFKKVSDLSLCDWVVKSRQETLYKIAPKVKAVVYHMEYHGDVACGRCYSYPFPKDWQECLSQACQRFAKPRKSEDEIQYPPERSRYITWTKNL